MGWLLLKSFLTYSNRMIADATGSELFELEPVNPYTDDDLDYRESNSRVSKEYENEAERNVELVSPTVDDFQDVSVVYLGYPKLYPTDWACI